MSGNIENGVTRIFDNIAPGYDLMNVVLSGGVLAYWNLMFRRALPGRFQGLCLDMGCGTLAFWRAMSRRWPQARCLGVDLSRPMLGRGLSKVDAAGRAGLLPVQGSGLDLPLVGECMDMVVCRFALRNMRPRRAVLAEALRVLKPGGALHILEFGPGRKRIWGGLYNFYLERVLPRLAGGFSPLPGAYDYLVRSILEFPGPEVIARELEETGFNRVGCRPLSSGIVYLFSARKE